MTISNNFLERTLVFSGTRKMKTKKSKYLDYFEIYKEKATCKTCGAVISCVGRSTSAMKYHMDHKHQDKIGYSSPSPPVKKLKVDSSSSSSIEKFVQIKKPSLEEIVTNLSFKPDIKIGKEISF